MYYTVSKHGIPEKILTVFTLGLNPLLCMKESDEGCDSLIWNSDKCSFKLHFFMLPHNLPQSVQIENTDFISF